METRSQTTLAQFPIAVSTATTVAAAGRHFTGAMPIRLPVPILSGIQVLCFSELHHQDDSNRAQENRWHDAGGLNHFQQG